MAENEVTWVYDRMRLYQLLKQHSDWTIKQFAETLRRSERWVKKWRQRFRDASEESIELFRRKPRAGSGSKITPLVRDAILDLREELSTLYRRPAGARRILYYLHQDEALKGFNGFIPKGVRTIWRILKEAGRIPSKRPILRCPIVLPEPMSEWELDFGLLKLADSSWFEFMPVIDRGTLILVHSHALPRYHADTALQTVAALLLAKGCPKSIRFDNDTRFVASWSSDGFPAAFVRFLLCLGIEADICDPGKPQQKPFVERVIGTIKHECFGSPRPATFEKALVQLEAFQPFYNHERPHQGRACNNQPPLSAFCELPILPSVPQRIDPDAWLSHYHGQTFRRSVASNGSVQVDKHSYYIAEAYAKRRVVLHLDATQKCFHVTCEGQHIKQLPIKDLYHGTMDFQHYLARMLEEASSLERHLALRKHAR